MRHALVRYFAILSLLGLVCLGGCGIKGQELMEDVEQGQKQKEAMIQANLPEAEVQQVQQEPEEAAVETPPVSKEAIKDAFSLKNKAGLAAPVEESKVGK